MAALTAQRHPHWQSCANATIRAGARWGGERKREMPHWQTRPDLDRQSFAGRAKLYFAGAFSARSGRLAAEMQSLRHAWSLHSTLLRNAAALATGAWASSVFGFVYWWVAARYLSLETVGLTAAAISIMSLIALIAELGLGPLLIAESLSEGKEQIGLISAALITAPIAALLLGTVLIYAAKAISADVGGITNFGYLLFLLGCSVTCFSTVLACACTGLLRSSLVMGEKFAFSLIKLTFLVLVVTQYGSAATETMVFATWVAGQTASALAFALYLGTTRSSLIYPRFSALRKHITTSLSHHVLNLVIQAPAVIMPFLVAVILSPAVTAAFNVSWMIFRVSTLLPTALSTMIFAVARSDPGYCASRVRLTLLLSAGCTIGVFLLLFPFSNVVLALFKPEYAVIASGTLKLLCISYFAVALNSVYLALNRIGGHMLFASLVFGIGGFAELFFASAGGLFGGLLGMSVGWVAATLLQSLFMAPAVLSAAAIKRGNGTIFAARGKNA